MHPDVRVTRVNAQAVSLERVVDEPMEVALMWLVQGPCSDAWGQFFFLALSGRVVLNHLM